MAPTQVDGGAIAAIASPLRLSACGTACRFGTDHTYHESHKAHCHHAPPPLPAAWPKAAGATCRRACGASSTAAAAIGLELGALETRVEGCIGTLPTRCHAALGSNRRQSMVPDGRHCGACSAAAPAAAAAAGLQVAQARTIERQRGLDQHTVRITKKEHPPDHQGPQPSS